MTPVEYKDIPFTHRNTEAGRIRKEELASFLYSDAEVAELVRISKTADGDAIGYRKYVEIMKLQRRIDIFTVEGKVYARRLPKYAR